MSAEVVEDIVNKPNHYHKGGIDPIGYGEQQFSNEEMKGFYRMNVIKYVSRYDKKNGAQDLFKAQFYIKKLIELEREEEGVDG